MLSLVPDPSSTTPNATPAGDYVQPTLNHGQRIWWAFYWRNILIAAVLGDVLGFVVMSLYERGTVSLEMRGYLLKIGPYVLSYSMAIFVLRYVIRRPFRRFRVGLLSIQGSGVPQEVPQTWIRTIRIWWTFTWRSSLVLIFLSFAASIPAGMVVGLAATLSLRLGQVLQGMIGVVLTGAASMYAIYSGILDEDFSDFRVSLLRREASRPELPAAEVAAAPGS